MSTKFKAFIFDLDGTVGDTLPLCISAFKKSIEPLLKQSLTDEQIIATFGPSEEGTIRQLVPDHHEEGTKQYLVHYEHLHSMCPAVFPGIQEILEELTRKEIKLGMVTGKGKYSTEISLRKFGIDQYFKICETGTPDGPDKVNGIRRIAPRLNIPLSESIYIGDAPSDIRYCREAGIPVISAAWASTAQPEELKALEPDYLFTSIEEFRKWIDQNI
ncbi:HAD family hydrolase [Pararcticibacter amylolyticus]|uniref:phosphoglycolate phosphatase n=1 Tax=Pararcticibacter amylolyticus TaxID=2173175 RepID=A0A2U2PAC3_9SPHI|nr:HAD family hydrolase [Pararcticibacter amylolyticus]PWG78337.1 hydrolase [Pararcticibacter amylolyticus]